MSSYQDEEEQMGYVGSFPKDFGYGPFEHDNVGQSPNEQKPRILLMGLRRSGKSSIQKVVFHKMSPNETLFLESTNKIVKDDINNSSFVQFSIWDFPGQIDFFDPTFDSDMIFGGCGALVFVIDAQDDYTEALSKLNQTVTKAYKVNPRIRFEVFIHKVDGVSDDFKMESQRDIHQRATDDLTDAGLDQIHLSFHLTSIYDHSIFEAFSKVVQKLIPQLPTLENLLNILISNSGIEKAFLFDVVSKIYIATDASPVDMQSYELCCDMIDVVIDLSCIYGLSDNTETTAFDNHSSSLIKLNNSTVLYLREVNKFLALVCILREDNFNRQGLIDYNFLCFREAITAVFELRNKIQKIENSDTSMMGGLTEEGSYKNSLIVTNGNSTVDSNSANNFVAMFKFNNLGIFIKMKFLWFLCFCFGIILVVLVNGQDSFNFGSLPAQPNSGPMLDPLASLSSSNQNMDDDHLPEDYKL